MASTDEQAAARVCECGHPAEAHSRRDGYDNLHRRVTYDPCRATVVRRHEHGDDTWPCPCRDFKEVKT